MVDITNEGGEEEIFEVPFMAILFTMVIIVFVIILLVFYIAPIYGVHTNPTNLTPNFPIVPKP